jgi:outer membrane protein OmpA-like peptidoglycan-associated protein
MESSLQSPQIAPLPQPEQAQPTPPPPPALSMPAGASSAANARGAHLPSPPAPAPMPAAIGSATFQPAPPPPNLPAPAPIRTATATEAGKPPKPARPAPPTVAYTQVADIAFSGDTTTLSAANRQTLDKIVPRYRQRPGPVRVVGYAGISTGAAEQLNSYRTAVDRAQAVAAALAKAGIPANKIEVQAAPAGAGSAEGRAEVLFGQ